MRSATRCVWLMLPCLAALTAWPLPAAEEKQPPADAPAAEKPAAEQSDAKKLGGQKPAAEQPDAKKPNGQKPSEEPAKKADPFVVPEGTPKELEEYIKKIFSTRITDAKTAIKARKAIMRAAEHIIAAQPDEKEMDFAVSAKLRMLASREQIDEFAERLHKDGHRKYARLVRGVGLGIDLSLTERREPEKRKQRIEAVLRFLAEEPPQPADARLALQAGKIAELTGDNKFASETYHSTARAFASSKEKKLVEFSLTLEGISRRLALPGNTMSIEGTLLGGATFDWSKYRGKVVLVNFWATWSGSSVAELSKLKKYYDRYHDKGFEIVGLSCDARPADLEKFVKERKIPWAIVYGGDKPSPTVTYYGVTDIPTNIMVDRDGTVLSLEARGLKLKEELKKLFAPADEKQ